MAKRTKDHDRARDVLAGAFREADPGSENEVVGLLHSERDLRPADVLTHGTGIWP